MMGGWKDMDTMMIYARKAGVNIKGASACLNLEGPSPTPNGGAQVAQVLQMSRQA
jgi:hypothetical protein